MIEKINDIYKECEKQLKKDFLTATEAFTKEDAIKAEQVKSGVLTKTEYKKWRRKELTKTKKMKRMIDSLAKDLSEADEVADTVAKAMYSQNVVRGYNAELFAIEKETKAITSFDLLSERSLNYIAKDNPWLLPKSKKFNIAKAKKWDKQRINTALLHGIAKGEGVDKIARRLGRVCALNKVQQVRTARTIVISARNAGGLLAMQNCEELGLPIEKVWVATLDDLTRPSHVDLDGESVPIDDTFSNGLKYPCDPNGAPEEVYNCRCSMVHNINGRFSDLSNVERNSKLGDMTYAEWKQLKGSQKA